MTLQKIGGFAALICAATYLFGFAFLVSTFAPLGFGTNSIDGPAVVAFIQSQPGLLILWNTVIYIINAIALALLVAALHGRLKSSRTDFAMVTLVLGIIWATLVIGAGMIGNVAVERAAHLAQTDVSQAVQVWQTLHAVELGLGGGNEIAGGIWIGCVSLAGLLGRTLGQISIGLGLVTAAGGLLTLFPAIGDVAGAVFGLGAIAWFIAIGCSLLFSRSATPLPHGGEVA
ncbi:hypothetical protein FHS89_003206 [Rubricella aquisinus]|uniref:DUF4386 family protein n=1 Tax=Rubricella aquisinus TaxID=2028108 RepID=A0A840WQ49_9RHOB|nr:DUF4386 family protein [Rubricella aquisinus]MBB5517159.1 hypothetical protein [Rubricella aquisinus]